MNSTVITLFVIGIALIAIPFIACHSPSKIELEEKEEEHGT
ncbi:MAG: hypothetical protein ACXAC2_17730 [Candidatus Kariarchaeaceae archaeon]|jgi:hypothetical protein